MNRFLKLVHFELNRFFKIYLVLIGMTILFQIIAVITESKTYLNRANDLIYKELMPKAQFIEQYGTFSFFEVTNSTWFLGPIALCIAALIIYVFFIWYRDWLGKNTFTYRLLMLPTDSNEYLFSKSDNDFTICSRSCSPAIIIIASRRSSVTNGWFQTEFRSDLSIYEITKLNYLNLFFPRTFLEFVHLLWSWNDRCVYCV